MCRKNSTGGLRLHGSDLGLGLITLFQFGHLLALY
jgi:hypothetical protein